MEGIIMNTSNITNYKPKDFAELLGVSVKTLQRWDREGILKANRTPTDRRYYTYDQYLQFKGINTENDNRQIVIYARVSTKNQKDDLQNQVTFLRQFCNAKGIIVDQCIEDYGSGLFLGHLALGADLLKTLLKFLIFCLWDHIPEHF